MDVNKEFDNYFEDLLQEPHDNDRFIEIRNKGYGGIKGQLKNAYIAGYKLAQVRIEELLEDLRKSGRDNASIEQELSDTRAMLNEAVEMIDITKDKIKEWYDDICNGCSLLGACNGQGLSCSVGVAIHKAEQFLAKVKVRNTDDSLSGKE